METPESVKSCPFCAQYRGEHDRACPTNPEEIRVWIEGFAAGCLGEGMDQECRAIYLLGRRMGQEIARQKNWSVPSSTRHRGRK